MAAEPANESSDFDSSSSSSAGELDATSTDDENDPSICSLCQATDRVITPIAGCDELKSITEYIESSSQNVKKVKYACQTCLYKLYTIIDQNRLKAFKVEREKRLAAVAVLIESSSSLLPSAMVETTGSGSSPEPTPSPPEATPSPPEATPSPPEPTPSPPEPTPSPPVPPSLSSNGLTNDVHQIELHHNVVDTESPSPSIFQDDEILVESEVLVETEDINNIELEGVQVINNEAQLDPNQNTEISSNPSSHSHLDVLYEQSESALITESGGTLDQYKNPPLECLYCRRQFVNIGPYKRHLRSHKKKHTVKSKSSCSRSRSPSGIRRVRTTPTNVYACTDCSATFDNAAKLKTHCRIHLKRFYCSYCQKENFSLNDHNFHEAECKGIQMAKEEFIETRRITRSIARSTRSTAISDKSPKSDKTAKSLRSRKNSLTKTVAFTNNADDDQNGYEDEDDDCATSGYTDYTVNTYVKNWVAGTYRPEYSSPRTPCTEVVEIPEKEYDILMIEKLISLSGLNVYTCFVLDCDYATNTLRDMCYHEVVVHKYKSFYNCRKCRGVFTEKMYLDFHYYTQTYAKYRCNKCPMHFNFEYELKYHFLQHREYEEFPCLYCGNCYMSAHDLLIHCIDTSHDPKKSKHTICIDHTMTIVNETPPEPPPPKRTYKCTINIMNLPKMPTKRPMTQIKWPKGHKKIFLGDIDFDMKPLFNCVRA